METIHKILVPTDFSPHADEAFRVAHALARAIGGGEVILFHVARPPAVASEGGPLLTDLNNGTTAANLWDQFHGLVPNDPRVRVAREVIIADQPDAAHLVEILDKLGCDLIVMGTHGHSWVRHLLFGSMTEDVVRLARCPVMVVKAPAHKAELPVAQVPTSQAADQAEAAHAG